MTFRFEYHEKSVLDTALFLAIREWEARLESPVMQTLRDETEAQLRIARDLKARLAA